MQTIPVVRDLKWSPAEKSVAHKAFDLARKREFEAIVAEAKRRAAKIEGPDDLWELEGWLGKRREVIDNKYDFRYSVLPMVFAQLIRDGRLTEDDLNGLGQDKLDWIRRLGDR